MIHLWYRFVLLLALSVSVCSALPDMQSHLRHMRERWRWPSATRKTTAAATSHISSKAITTPTTEDHKKSQDGDTSDSTRKDDDWGVQPRWRWDNDPPYLDDWPLSYWVDNAPWSFGLPWGAPPWNSITRRYYGPGWKELDVIGKREGRWTLSPKLDLRDRDGNTMVATFELPGLRKEDVHIEIDDQNRLIVSGESHLSAETDRDGYIFRERRIGRFRRVLDIPPGTEVDEVHAHLSDGVLTVTFPKTSRAQLPRRKRVAIASG